MPETNFITTTCATDFEELQRHMMALRGVSADMTLYILQRDADGHAAYYHEASTFQHGLPETTDPYLPPVVSLVANTPVLAPNGRAEAPATPLELLLRRRHGSDPRVIPARTRERLVYIEGPFGKELAWIDVYDAITGKYAYTRFDT